MYKHFEVPYTEYNLLSLLLSNVISLGIEIDVVIVPVRSTCADIVAITAVWQIVPEMCTMETFELFHHLRINQKGDGVTQFCRSVLNLSHCCFIVPL